MIGEKTLWPGDRLLYYREGKELPEEAELIKVYEKAYCIRLLGENHVLWSPPEHLFQDNAEGMLGILKVKAETSKEILEAERESMARVFKFIDERIAAKYSGEVDDI